ncbi:MAG: NYN domain-containing protein [Candidatus Thorarchaeota archaeon]
MISVYFDVSDLYYKVKKFHNKKVNYKEVMKYLSSQFGEIYKAEAFGCQTDNEAQSFIAHLKSADITVKYRRPKVYHVGDHEVKSCNWNVDITISAICSDSDTFIFCTSNQDLIPLYRHLQNMQKKVIVIGCGVPDSVKYVVDVCIPIPEECMA